jgi:hypothetical protein
LRLEFEIPYIPEFKGVRDPQPRGLLTVQTHPAHILSKVCDQVSKDLLYDQKISLMLPTFAGDVARSNIAERWFESALQEFSIGIKDVELSESFLKNEIPFKKISGRTTKWGLNDQVVKVIDFANRFKKEFDLKNVYLALNDEESTI